MLKWFVQKIVGTQNQREIKKLDPLVRQINDLEQSLQSLTDEQLQAKTDEFKNRLQSGETPNDLLPEAFAVVKNACRRFTDSKRVIQVRGHDVIWNMIPFDVQLVGGIALHQGKIAEMATGEGKTLVATMPVYLNALTGNGVHVITVNDYLASRDAEWMGEVYKFLGMTVGCIQHGQNPEERRAQYQCDITYGTCSEFGFDYLRDNGMATTVEEQVQRGHAYAIIDEVDSILIDEARTPLIISGPVTVDTHQYDKYKNTVASLVRRQNTLITDTANQAKKLIDEGNLEEAGRLLFKVKLGMPRNKLLLKLQENPNVRKAIDDAELALYVDSRRTELYKLKEELYFSIDEKSSEADPSEMGRKFLSPDDPDTFLLPDLITLHHDIDQDSSKTPEEKEQAKQQVQRDYDEASQRIHNISQLLRAYCVFEQDVHYVIQDNKVIIVDEYTGRLMPGRRWSDGLHQAVEAKEGVKIDKETQTLATITIQNYFRLYEKLSGMTGTAETEANEFKDIYKLGVLVIPTNRPCVRKDFDDLIYKTRREKLNAVVAEIKERHGKGQPLLVGTASVESSEVLSRMLKRENIPHSVLNAKFHQQEAEIVARAGQKGAVTIATNMAGRGTDIKLGPGIAELGGLHVLGTERHEARRIDRQLRGRCARQGDPGSSQFYISFEDDLMRNFADSRKMADILSKMGMQDGESIQHPMMNRSVETAQKRVEDRNYQIRKHTLQYDDVMNQQRTVIYSYRNDVLTTDNPREEIFNVLDEALQTECEARLATDDLAGLIKWLNTNFPLAVRKEDFKDQTNPLQIVDDLKKRIREAYELKIKYENAESAQALERYVVLNAIDRLWQEHLYAMDGLRTSIGLRAYGQKDPLIEYKQDAYVMFEQLMGDIKGQIVQNIFRSSTSLTAFEQFLRALPQRTQRGQMPNLGAPSSSKSHAEESETAKLSLPVRHVGKKMGRNDPCPLDPKKKFKNCCGAGGGKYCTRAQD